MTDTRSNPPLVSYESVATAAQALKDADERPSVRNVIRYLGGGSPNAVLRHLREWEAGRPVVTSADLEITDEVKTALQRMVDRATEQAVAASEERAAKAEDTLEVFETEQARLEADLERLTGERDELTEALAQARDEAAQQAREQEQEREHHAEAVAELKAELERERERLEAAHKQIAQAEIRLEAMPDLQAEIERVREQLTEAQAAEKAQARAEADAEKAQAVAEARAEAATQAAQAAQTQAEKAEARAEQERQERRALQERLAALEAKQKAPAKAGGHSSKQQEKTDCVPMRAAPERRRVSDAQQAREAYLSSRPGQAGSRVADWLAADPVFLDTETTGLDDRAQVVEVGIVDAEGRVLFESYCKPTVPVDPAAEAVHGIGAEVLAGAPAWPEIADQVRAVLEHRLVVIFNAEFDLRLLSQTAAAHGTALDWIRALDDRCAMEGAAGFYGATNRHGTISLANAAAEAGVTFEGRAHSAVADAATTAAVVRAIAEQHQEKLAR